MVKNLPYNEEDSGSIPGLGTKIPHAEEQLSLCITIAEACNDTILESARCNKRCEGCNQALRQSNR